MDEEVHLIFPVSGGPIRGSFVGKHSDTPIVTEQKVRLLSCNDEAEAEGELMCHEFKNMNHDENQVDFSGEAEVESESEAESESSRLEEGQ